MDIPNVKKLNLNKKIGYGFQTMVVYAGICHQLPICSDSNSCNRKDSKPDESL